MPTYTKLFGSIIASTIWLESDHTRLVWITMLALADKNGEVHASIPGLAKFAGVPLEACRAALVALMSPDPDSRTKTAEGRRIVEIDGGWELINHAKYRALASTADAIEANKVRQARFRKRNAEVTDSNGGVTPSNAPVTPDGLKAEAKADTKADAEANPPKPRKRGPRRATPPLECAAFDEFWAAYPKKQGKEKAEEQWVKRGCAKILPQILVTIRKFKATEEWTKDGGQFVPQPAKWLGGRRWEDEPSAPPVSHASRPGGLQENIEFPLIVVGNGK